MVDIDAETGQGTGLVKPIDINKRKGSAQRKTSVVPTAIPPEVLHAAQLNDADRRLAEMGYTQVCLHPMLPPKSTSKGKHQGLHCPP